MRKPSHAKTLPLLAIAVVLMASAAAAQTVVYVDQDAPGANNGSSWADAFTDLQDGLAEASTNGAVSEIHVAAGTYRPDRGTGDQEATFQLVNGVAVMGGYAGHGEPDPNARDIAAYETILSGDLLGNDGPNFSGYGDNSYHVVTGSGTSATAVIDGFTVTGGNAAGGGGGRGGGMYNDTGSPTVRNCKFIGNQAYGSGGGMYNQDSSPTLLNCVFSGNLTEGYAYSDGGGIYNTYSSPVLANCTFSANSAEDAGGGMCSEYANPVVINCIFWGNTGNYGITTEDNQIYHFHGVPSVSFCCIEGWSGAWGGSGNFGADPLFVDANGADGYAGTLDDDLHLAPGSPCINVGYDNAVNLPEYDFEGDARVQHCRVDIGADETDSFLADCNSNAVADACDLADGTSEDCNHNDIPDECEPDEDCNTNGIQDICDLAAGTAHDWNRNGILDACDIAAGTSADLNGDGVPDESVLFVDADAVGANDGSSWADAYTDLQSAVAASTNGVISQVRVAAGTYAGGLQNGVAVIGGYAGYGEPDPDLRDIDSNATILSALVVGSGVDASAVLDGFTFTGEQAAGTYGNGGGAAIRIEYGSPTILDCTFHENSANWDGGAVYNVYGRPTFVNCVFLDNHAGHDGGAVCNHNGHVTLIDCLFIGNSADNDGGGLFTDGYWADASATLIACTFIENTADPVYGFGGGVWSGNNATLSNCVFSRNAAYAGGGMYNSWGSASLLNCTFSANQAFDDGAGFFSYGLDSVATLTNCILWANEDSEGVTDEGNQVFASSGQLAVDYSCVQGWSGLLAGVGNIADDPLLVDVAGDDHHLQADSPCINAGDDTADLPLEDFEGDARVQHCRVDIGADETGFFRDCNTNGAPDACELPGVHNCCETLHGPGCSDPVIEACVCAIDPYCCESDWDRICADLVVSEGCGLCDFVDDCNANGIPDECEPDCNGNGIADECDVTAGTSADCNANGTPDECDIATGASADDNLNEIPDECEAEVLYVDEDAVGANHGTNWTDAYNDLQLALAVAAQPGNAVRAIWTAAGVYLATDDGDRGVSFRLVSGVAVYGGFAGGESALEERDPAVNLTVLSGDLEGNDATTNGLDENSHHVVVADGADVTAVLDGFVLTAGNADFEPHTTGGGMVVRGACPTIANCTFLLNAALWGGGMYVEDGDPAVINCTLAGNWADFEGGGLYNECGSPAIINTAFTGNVAVVQGGAIYNSNVSSPTLTNCSLAGNQADEGAGIYSGYGAGVTVANSILWRNQDAFGFAEVAQIDGTEPVIDYSCVQGWTGDWGGSGNLGDDPLLADPDGADDLAGTLDDNLSLSIGSPCIDAADNEAYADAGTSGLLFLPDTDLAGDPRFFDDPTAADTGTGTPPIVDMGAYEYQGDCNGNGVADDIDVASGTSSDYNSNGIPDECEPDCDSNGIPDDVEPDCNGNGIPDACELAPVAETRVYHVYAGDLVDCPEDCGSGPYGCFYYGFQPGFTWTDTFTGPVSEVKIEFNVGHETTLGVTTRGTSLNGLPEGSFDSILYDQCVPTAGNLVTILPDVRTYLIGELNVFRITGPAYCVGFAPRAEFDGAFARITVKVVGDCNGNDIPDVCDIDAGTSADINTNDVPDECEPDCNHNGLLDEYEIAAGISPDCNTNGMPDVCELPGFHNCCETVHGPGCNDAVIEACVCAIDPYCCEVDWDRICADLVVSEGCGHCDFAEDCNTNGVPDECDIAAGTSLDCNATEVPDECEMIGDGDVDADGDVDLDDFAFFPDCLAGAGTLPEPSVPDCVDACLAAFDFEADADVDLGDFAAFQALFTEQQ